jgi:hypothetical protein
MLDRACVADRGTKEIYALVDNVLRKAEIDAIILVMTISICDHSGHRAGARMRDSDVVTTDAGSEENFYLNRL